MRGDHAAEKRESVGIVHGHVQQLADLPAIAVEDHDAVAVRAADELHGLAAVVLLRGASCWALRPAPRTLAADQRLVVLLADRVLNGQQLVVAALLDVLGHVVGIELSRSWCPGARLYLKIKLFLNRDSRTSSTVC